MKQDRTIKLQPVLDLTAGQALLDELKGIYGFDRERYHCREFDANGGHQRTLNRAAVDLDTGDPRRGGNGCHIDRGEFDHARGIHSCHYDRRGSHSALWIHLKVVLVTVAFKSTGFNVPCWTS